MIRRLLLLAAVAMAVAGCDVARWNMNETSGRAMNDSVGGHTGLTTDVTLGLPGHEGTAYGFNGSSSIAGVADSADLDPGTANFSFGAQVNFTVLPPPYNPDVIRKGVTGDPGGYYKLELFTAGGTAKARCYFEDGSGHSATAGGGTGLNNGQWRDLACIRSGNQFSLSIDGNIVKTATATVGGIANSNILTIGAKPPNGDHFNGRIDDAFVSVG